MKVEHAEPLELVSLSRALTRLGQRYKRFARADGAEQSTLFITDIREGSLIVDLSPLVAMAGVAANVGDPINTAVDFVRNLKATIEYFLGKGAAPDGLTRRDCDEIKDIVQPIAIQRDGNLNIQAASGAHVAVTVNLNAVEANAVQNRAAQERERLNEPTSRRFDGVVFYWQVADKSKSASEGATPDRGVIEAIDRIARKVFFTDPDLKSDILSRGHPFETGYLVDGEVLVAKDRVQGYRISAVHDSFPLE